MRSLTILLFFLPLSLSAQVESRLSYEGQIIDSLSRKPLYGVLMFTPIDQPDSVRIISSEGQSGRFRYSLEPGKTYVVEVQVTGYLPFRKEVKLSFPLREEVLELEGLLRGDLLQVRHLNFEQNSAMIKTGFQELDQVASYLLSNDQVKLLLEGHTEPQGSAAANKKLAMDRISTVKNYLVQRGVPAGRIKLKSYGGTQPISKGTSPADRALNRRVAFKLIL